MTSTYPRGTFGSVACLLAATQGTQDEDKQNKTQHNKCWTPLYINKTEKTQIRHVVHYIYIADYPLGIFKLFFVLKFPI